MSYILYMHNVKQYDKRMFLTVSPRHKFFIFIYHCAANMQIETYITVLTWKYPMKLIEDTARRRGLIEILNPAIFPFPYADL